LRVGVLASGAGTNLQAILDRTHGRDGIEVVAVGSDKPDAMALERAALAGVATAVFARESYPDRPARDLAMARWLHPALLPSFPGIRAIEQALEYGVKVFGVTVHFVDEGVDTGPIILQRAVELPRAMEADEVREALRPIEHDLLCEAVSLLARDAVRLDPAHPRRVLVVP
jgi:phosphoribosylglycinamide formyltransferase 1